ncbi:MAG: sugar ABC transporter permease [Clostridia bacterium]|nr:sugar ABC transporter permease [Clostridia bacterium]
MMKKGRLTMQQQRTLGGILMSLPSFLVLFLFFIGPMLLAILLSFTNWKGTTLTFDFIGFSNYVKVFNTPNFGQLMFNTVYLILLYVPLLNIVALVMATLIYGISRKLGTVSKSAIFFPNLLAPVVVGFIWLILYQYQNGIFNKILRGLGIDALAHDWLGDPSTAMPAISLSILWFAIGYFLIIYTAGLTTIPDDLYENAEVEGANRVQSFFGITIPMLAPSITINVILSTIGCIATFEFPLVMTKGGPGSYTRTMGYAIWNYAYGTRQQGHALAIAVIMALIAMLIAFGEWLLLHKQEEIY